MQKGVKRLVSGEGQKILRLPGSLKIIRREKLILHGKRSISASCRALQQACREGDFSKKWCFLESGNGHLSGLSVLMPVWDRHYLLGEEIQEVQYPLMGYMRI